MANFNGVRIWVAYNGLVALSILFAAATGLLVGENFFAKAMQETMVPWFIVVPLFLLLSILVIASYFWNKDYLYHLTVTYFSLIILLNLTYVLLGKWSNIVIVAIVAFLLYLTIKYKNSFSK